MITMYTAGEIMHPVLQYSSAFLVPSESRGPHRYTRTVRVPILRPKIPVINRINSSRYFFTGTMNKPPRC